MTLDEMKAIYQKATGKFLPDAIAFTVRVFDGMDGVWCDVARQLTLDMALREWCTHTENGTKHTKYSDIDYYDIFDANTKMLYSDGHTMHRGDE